MNKRIKIIVATHKKYDMPKNNLFLPIQVGSANKEDIGFLRDDSGENISEKNPFFCELTGLYWAWKNLNEDYIGLVHYRRYLAGDFKFEVNGEIKNIISREQIEKLLSTTDVVLPTKRNYYIETLYSHYAHTMYVEPLDITGQIIGEKYPQYLDEFNKLKERRSAHMFNMFVMKKEVLDKYCTWLFDILFELEKRVDTTKYNAFHARFFGRISELLLDVWVNANNIDYKEVKLCNIEKVNFWKKTASFLKAKFGGKKYDKSF